MAAGHEPRVCVGAFAGAHGVRGQLKVKSFTATAEDVTAYGAVTDESGGRTFEMTVTGRAKGLLLVRVPGIEDRDAAEALRGTKLFVRRGALPPLDEEEHYLVDLIGLEVEGRDGRSLGRVKAVQNFGGGDMLEVVGPDGRELLLPFTKAAVSLVDIAGGRLIAEPPREIVARPDAAAAEDSQSGLDRE